MSKTTPSRWTRRYSRLAEKMLPSRNRTPGQGDTRKSTPYHGLLDHRVEGHGRAREVLDVPVPMGNDPRRLPRHRPWFPLWTTRARTPRLESGLARSRGRLHHLLLRPLLDRAALDGLDDRGRGAPLGLGNGNELPSLGISARLACLSHPYITSLRQYIRQSTEPAHWPTALDERDVEVGVPLRTPVSTWLLNLENKYLLRDISGDTAHGGKSASHPNI